MFCAAWRDCLGYIPLPYGFVVRLYQNAFVSLAQFVMHCAVNWKNLIKTTHAPKVGCIEACQIHWLTSLSAPSRAAVFGLSYMSNK